MVKRSVTIVLEVEARDEDAANALLDSLVDDVRTTVDLMLETADEDESWEASEFIEGSGWTSGKSVTAMWGEFRAWLRVQC